MKYKEHLDLLFIELKELVLSKSNESSSQWGHKILRYQRRLFVYDVHDLRGQILEEAQGFRYSILSGATKMYRDLQEIY